MARTHVILDGLSDPLLGQALSAKWAQAGFHNVVDVAGQAAHLERTDDPTTPLTELDLDRAAGLARGFGLEIRDRAGESFIAANHLDKMYQRMEYEYRSRLATGVMFILPAIVLHYIAPLLAVEEGSGLFFPWLFELLLIGWACLAAGWPILWQGGLSLLTIRGTADLLTSLILLAAFVPSAIGLLLMLLRIEPFYLDTGPAFHAAGYALLIAVAQRWLLYRNIDHLTGRGMLMLLRFGRLIGAWVIVAAIVWIVAGWHVALGFALLLPPMASQGAINPWNPGWASLLPTFAFALLVLIDPGIASYSLTGVHIEVAAIFALVQTGVMAAGWRKIQAHMEPEP